MNVEEYIKTAGGNWLNADDVVVGDKLEILDGGIIDEETFDRAYVVILMRLLRTGEEFNVRLGPKNVTRIAETLGNDTTKWVRHQAEIISIEQYKGLGTKGFLLRGVKAEPQQTLPPSPPGKVGLQEAISKTKNWSPEDQKAYIDYLRNSGQLVE